MSHILMQVYASSCTNFNATVRNVLRTGVNDNVMGFGSFI